MKMACIFLKRISLVLIVFQCVAAHANPYIYRFRESGEESRNRYIFEQLCKKHPSLKIYHDSLDAIRYSDLYRLRPGNLIVEGRRELDFGPINRACGAGFGMFQQLILSPVTLFASPWIMKKHLKLKRIEKVANILDELYIVDKGSSNLESFLENLYLSYPEVSKIQKLKLGKLKRILIDLDQKGEFCRALYGNRIVDEEEELFSWSTPRRLLSIQELRDLVFNSLQGVTEDLAN